MQNKQIKEIDSLGIRQNELGKHDTNTQNTNEGWYIIKTYCNPKNN